MAGGAGDGAGRGQLGVLEQALAERDLGGGRRIVGGIGDERRPRELGFERGKRVGGLLCARCRRVGPIGQRDQRAEAQRGAQGEGACGRTPTGFPSHRAEGASSTRRRGGVRGGVNKRGERCRPSIAVQPCCTSIGPVALLGSPHPRPLPARGRGARAGVRGWVSSHHQYLEACSSMSEISADISPGSRIGACRRHRCGPGGLELGERAADLRQRVRVGLGKLGRGALDHALGLPDEAAAVLVLDGLGEAAVLDGCSYSPSATFRTSAAERAVKPRNGVMNLLRHVQRALEPLVHHLERLLVGALALGLDGLGQRLQLAAEGADVVQLDVFLHRAVELFGGMQEVRQRLVPEPELDQLPADQEMAAHQRDVAVEANAGVARAAVGEVGLAARVRGLVAASLPAAGGGWPGGPCARLAPPRRPRPRRRQGSPRRCRPRACASALPCGFHGVRPLSPMLAVYTLSQSKGV